MRLLVPTRSSSGPEFELCLLSVPTTSAECFAMGSQVCDCLFDYNPDIRRLASLGLIPLRRPRRRVTISFGSLARAGVARLVTLVHSSARAHVLIDVGKVPHVAAFGSDVAAC